MPVIRVSDDTIQRLKTWAEPLEDTVNSALSKALDAAEAKRDTDLARSGGGGSKKESHAEAFVTHLLAMPDVGDDADFERDPSPAREIEL